MRISLVRSGLQPDHLQDQGEHYFTYSLLPHGGDFVEGKTVQSAYQLNNPAKVVKGACKLGFDGMFTLDNDAVEVDAVKRAEDQDALIIRFHEYTGSRQKVTLTPGFAYKSWTESDLRERPLGEECTGAIELELHPYEVKTIMLSL